jgi:DNA polymerase III delta prime subunit
MIGTQLVLLEGPPGSGKTTTAQYLSTDISNAGIPCQCFLEWSEDNPITIGDDLHLDQAVSSSITRESEVLQQWKRFVQARQTDKLVTVMESRFWQTSLMLMYAAGYPRESILASNQRVIETIGVLQPALIWFAIDDLRAFTIRTLQIKEEEWQRAGYLGNWAQHVYEAFDSQKWFTDRGLSGLTGMLAFLDEWALITNDLYDRLAFPKIEIRNPYKDWSAAMRHIRGFLDLV